MAKWFGNFFWKCHKKRIWWSKIDGIMMANTTHIFKSVRLFFNAVQGVPLASNDDVWNARFVGFDLTNSATVSSGCHSWKTWLYFEIRSDKKTTEIDGLSNVKFDFVFRSRSTISIFVVCIYLVKPLDKHYKTLVSNE